MIRINLSKTQTNLSKIIKILNKQFYIIILILFTIILQGINPFEANALTHDWQEVRNSKYGKQVWDKSSYQINNDGSIRILSKFIPETKNEITSEILYTMDINCKDNTYRDVAIGQENFNEFKNSNANWEDPNNDQLILGVINQVCSFKN